MNTLDERTLTRTLYARTTKALAADSFAERAFRLERHRWESPAHLAGFTIRTAAYIAASTFAYATDADWYRWQKAASALPESLRQSGLTLHRELSDDSALTFYASHDFSWRLWKASHPTFEWFVILTRRIFNFGGLFERDLREKFLKFVAPGLNADGTMTFTQMNQALVLALAVTHYLLSAQHITEADCVTRHVPAIEAEILTALDACGGNHE